jgi:predicted DNA-binding transcriptional regulator YafY
MNRIDRLTGMILLLQTHRVITAEKIAAHFEISVRTVYRDLSALGEAGVPIQAEAGTGYSLMRGYHVPPVMFTEDEAAALFVSGEIATQVADDSLRQALRDALLKIRSVLTPERRHFLNRLSQSISIRVPTRVHGPGSSAALMPLQQAVVHRQCVSLRYDASRRGEITERVVEPLGLVFYANHWHLIAHCRLRGAVRNFRLDRLEHLAVLPETFHADEGFSLKEFLAEEIANSQVIPTVVHFSPRAMERVRTELYWTTLTETPLPGGWTRAESLAYSMDWLAAWLLSFGSEMEIVAPFELKKKACELALDIASRHHTAESWESRVPA